MRTRSIQFDIIRIKIFCIYALTQATLRLLADHCADPQYNILHYNDYNIYMYALTQAALRLLADHCADPQYNILHHNDYNIYMYALTQATLRLLADHCADPADADALYHLARPARMKTGRGRGSTRTRGKMHRSARSHHCKSSISFPLISFKGWAEMRLLGNGAAGVPKYRRRQSVSPGTDMSNAGRR